jgi:hypothetical protein
VSEPASDQERLFTLLAMLPWQHDPQGHLFPPDALRSLLGVDASSMPEPDAIVDKRWGHLTNVAYEFDRLLAAGGHIGMLRPVSVLAMRVLDSFEPLDVEIARVIGDLLVVKTAGRPWVEDVTATAWRIVSSFHGGQRLAELRHHFQ